MCDTLYRKISSQFIFGKNSDRSPNEPNLVIFYPKTVQSEKLLQCTYISIEQVPITNAILLVQPSWMWGGEMGINEKGVVIGNEAVFTKSRTKKPESLLGMDMLRLALERGNSANDSLEIIISLLEKYGQGGNCAFDKKFLYDNSFLIADKQDAFVLETCSKDFVVYKIEDYYNISNRLSLNNNYYKSSNQNQNFAERNSNKLITSFSGSYTRSLDASNYLKQKDFNLRVMFEALRHHHEKDEYTLYSKGSVRSLCMHKAFIGDHTTSSMVVETHEKFDTIWLTGSSTPCLSLFKPTYFANTIAPIHLNKNDSLNYWLEREYLIRAIYGRLIDLNKYKQELAILQNKFIEDEKEMIKNNPSIEDLTIFSKKCSQLEQIFVNSYANQIHEIKNRKNILPKVWQKYTNKLGKNVFYTDLKKRLE